MSNIDRIVEMIVEKMGITYVDLASSDKLYIYAQAMLLDKQGMIIDLKVRKDEVIKEQGPLSG